QTSPCLAAYWAACTTRMCSFTERPKAVVLTVACTTVPDGSIRKEARRALTPDFTPYRSATTPPRSSSSGNCSPETPPSSMGAGIQLKWENLESTETPSTSTPISLSCGTTSDIASSSVGQTKVKSNG